MTVSDQDLKCVVQTIKTVSIDAVEKAKSGHPGTPMGLAEIGAVLWLEEMIYDPSAPDWEGRDRFVLSPGHASMLIYSLLHLAGFPLSLDDLKAFRQWGSKTPGHPEAFHTAGVETTTGPLGQGVGNGVGFALAQKMKAAQFGAPFAGRTYVIASDGDLMEGVSGEASSLAGLWGLSNLVVFYDDNRITIDGDTSISFMEDVGKRYEAYGWNVLRIDGHDIFAIRAALKSAREEQKRPTFVVARTHIANGAPHAVDTSEAHGAPLGAAEIAAVKTQMGLDPNQTFFVPEQAKSAFAGARSRGAAARLAWEKQLDSSPKRGAYTAFASRAVPADFYEQLLAKLPKAGDATRSDGGALLQAVAELLPGLVGGAADLAGSTKTVVKSSKHVSSENFGARNIHFGIREHGMGAICNALALSGGFIPFASTFLVFSDYMRPSIRLSALMGLPCWWIFTHDSFYLGEDGPTHQPIEHLASLRLIPNLAVVRPADALEVAAGFAIAAKRMHAPTLFALTRHKLAKLERPAAFKPTDALRGGYVVVDCDGAPEVVLIATGSEVGLACDVQKQLASTGKRARVVSLLCAEVFAKEDAAYRSQVLPASALKVSIEAGRSEAFLNLLGGTGLAIGIDHFGASAPDMVLAEKFGFTADAIVARILSHSST
jgi:transketolase